MNIFFSAVNLGKRPAPGRSQGSKGSDRQMIPTENPLVDNSSDASVFRSVFTPQKNTAKIRRRKYVPRRMATVVLPMPKRTRAQRDRRGTSGKVVCVLAHAFGFFESAVISCLGTFWNALGAYRNAIAHVTLRRAPRGRPDLAGCLPRCVRTDGRVEVCAKSVPALAEPRTFEKCVLK